MENRKLEFRKGAPAVPPPDAEGGSATAERGGSFARIFGALKETVTIAPGTDLTDLVDED